MKIADFFVQITAKGDLKELKMIADAQKAIKEQSKMAIAAAKVKVAELKKETVEIQKQAKQKKEEPKTLKDILVARGKMFDQQAKMNLLMGKGILQTIAMKNGVSALAAGFVIATLAIDKMVMKLAQANQAYINFQRQTGMSMAVAQGMSAAMAGVDVTMTPEEVMQNMQNLQSNLIGVQFGMGNIAPYQMAGINPMGANFDTIRKQLKGFAPAYRTFLLQQMGLDPRLGALINMSDKEYASMKAEQSMLYLDPQVRKDIQIVGVEVNKMFLAMKKMKDLIVVILGHLARPITAFLKMALNTVNIILEGLAKMPAIMKSIEAIGLALSAIFLKWWALLIPIFEDLAVWASGGKSLFGAIFEDPERAFGAIGEHLQSFFSNIFGNDFWTNLKDTIVNGIKEAIFGRKNATKIEESEGTSLWQKQLFGKTALNKFFQKTPFFLPLFTGSLLKDVIKSNVTNNNGRDISMKNDIEIKVGSVSDGYEMANRMDDVFNGLIAQWG